MTMSGIFADWAKNLPKEPDREELLHLWLAVTGVLGEDYDLDRIRELLKSDRDGRCVVLPKDGMVYYIEEAGGEKWVANKPIQQITVKCGWGLASLEFSLFDAGKYFTREAASAALHELGLGGLK